MSRPKDHDLPTQSGQDSLGGCAVRLAWMLVGNAALALCAVFIAQHTPSFFSAADLAYWAIVPALAGVRYLDIQKLKGLTVTAQPATMAHWRRYVALLLGVSFLVWAAAHGVARLAH